MRKPLVVYEASAGSGKTYTLAAEYITLLVRNPQAYRQTLAVTFTNKATEEMKTRILSQLYGIWKGLPKSDSYLSFVCKRLEVSQEHVRKQAGIALQNLLHNYSYFRVETIDSFFQRVLRNLARELDLTTTMRIGLNDVQVEEQAVDELIEELTTTDVVLQWLMRYIVDNINDDRSWNVIGQIKQFGRTIFRDYYKRESKELQQAVNQKGFFDHYTSLLRDMRDKAETTMKSIGTAFMEELESVGLEVKDFSYGSSGVAGLFLKLRNGQFDPSVLGKRVTECVATPEKWCKKSHERCQDIYVLADGVLGTLLRQAIEEQPRQWKIFQSATLTLRHLSQLRLLETIEKRVRQQNENNNLFLLSDTQHLLHEIIDGSDSPFIFEKTGAQLEHIMIDEFQDTSTVQWQNFKVLLNETMSHTGAESLIVGDVKQSIYRWRSGDWRLLAGIEKEFGKGMVERIPLKYNYRSCRNIIDFNNAFFMEAAKTEQVGAYDTVYQEIPEGKPHEGFVSIRLLPDDNYQETVLQMLCDQVSELIANDVPYNDIAILLRANTHIALIANYFMEHLPEVPVVSDEAFRLDASPAVNVIVQAMRFLANPNDIITKAFLAKAWSNQLLHNGELDDYLPKELKESSANLLQMPLYELAERLYAIFGLERMGNQSAYLCTFYDQISSFVNEQMGDLSAFIKEWDENLCGKTIQSPEADGIRLISIHKSKGLEFPTVIIPFCDWRMEHSDILWCKPDEAPFNLLPIVPIDYSAKQMEGTIYEKDYTEEHQQTTVDNLNLLYVAFTRAERNLYVIGLRNTKASRSAIIEQVLPQIKLNNSVMIGKDAKDQTLEFRYGTLTLEKQETEDGEEQKNVFLKEPSPVKIDIHPYKPRAVFLQSDKSREFAADTNGSEEEQQASYIQLGNVLHHIFSTIHTVEDVDRAIQELEGEGIIYDDNITRERLTSLIRKRLTDPRVAQWFLANGNTEGWKVFNECSIISVDPHTNRVIERRPDRVITNGNEMIVIDFKFGKPRDEYHKQIGQYMELLKNMGYKNVKGYLWFVYSNQIVEVKA